MSVGRRLSGCWISLMPWALALSTLALDQRLFSLLCRNLAVWSQSRLWHTSNTALRVQTPSLDPWSQPSTQAVVVLVLTVILCKELNFPLLKRSLWWAQSQQCPRPHLHNHVWGHSGSAQNYSGQDLFMLTKGGSSYTMFEYPDWEVWKKKKVELFVLEFLL